MRLASITIDRNSFMFNPTNCSPLVAVGSVSSFEGAMSPISSPFQVANCSTLGFGPKLSASTSSKHSKANGESLTTKLAFPKAPFGSQANITKVKVELPKQLPSRLSTLQKACVAAVFEADPSHCPAGSVVGHATARTPVLPVPLAGPAYLVSHGGEAFPSLTLVLSGYGVTVDLVGTTLIRNGITSTTFKTVPDVPVSSFELSLPKGPHSVLTGIGNICKKPLLMPTVFYGQNGKQLASNTKITATGCKKAHRKSKHRKPKHHNKRKK